MISFQLGLVLFKDSGSVKTFRRSSIDQQILVREMETRRGLRGRKAQGKTYGIAWWEGSWELENISAYELRSVAVYKPLSPKYSPRWIPLFFFFSPYVWCHNEHDRFTSTGHKPEPLVRFWWDKYTHISYETLSLAFLPSMHLWVPVSPKSPATLFATLTTKLRDWVVTRWVRKLSILYRSWRLGRYRLPGPVLSLKQALLWPVTGGCTIGKNWWPEGVRSQSWAPLPRKSG